MTKKIAIIGTHGTLKSTLSFNLCAKLKAKGKNVELIQELVRKCPREINGKDFEAQRWIMDAYSLAENEARSPIAGRKPAEYIVCDRSILDIYLYTVNMCERQKLVMPNWMSIRVKEDIRSYDFLFKTEVLKEGLVDDGTRCVEPEWQEEIAGYFDDALRRYKIDHYPLPYDSIKGKTKLESEDIEILTREQVDFMLSTINP